jgi:hypothetical protein
MVINLVKLTSAPEIKTGQREELNLQTETPRLMTCGE